MTLQITEIWPPTHTQFLLSFYPDREREREQVMSSQIYRVAYQVNKSLANTPPWKSWQQVQNCNFFFRQLTFYPKGKAAKVKAFIWALVNQGLSTWLSTGTFLGSFS